MEVAALLKKKRVSGSQTDHPRRQEGDLSIRALVAKQVTYKDVAHFGFVRRVF